MKNLFFSLCALLCFSFAAEAQYQSYSYFIGQSQSRAKVIPFGDEGWAVALDFRIDGNFGQDSMLVLLIDKNGFVYKKNSINPTFSAAIHYPNSILACSDKGLLLCYEGTVCDVVQDRTSLVKLDSNLTIQWQTNEPFVGTTLHQLPKDYFNDSDGNILGISDKEVLKLNVETGAYMGLLPLTGLSYLFGDMVQIEGTADYLLAKSNSFYRIKKNTAAYTAELLTTFDNLNGPFQNLVHIPNSDRYIATSYQTIASINLNTLDTSLQSLNHRASFAQPLADKLFVYGDTSLSLVADSHLVSYPLASSKQKFYAQSSANNHKKVIYLGTDYAQNLRYTIFDSDSIYDKTPIWNASLLSVRNESEYTKDLWGYIAHDVKIRVKNTGIEPIDSILIYFKQRNSDYCGIRFLGQKKFYKLNLKANEEVELDFGTASFSSNFWGEELPFWVTTLGPYPDANSYDDLAYLQTFLGDKTPTEHNTAFYPNPTSGILHFQEIIEKPTDIQIFSILGQKVGQTTLQNTGNQLDISNLAKGIYVLRWDGFYQKIILE